MDKYEDLLRKYINHVIESEGIDFLGGLYVELMEGKDKYSPFTEKEYNILNSISNK